MEAVGYYAKHIHSNNNVLLVRDSEGKVSIDNSKRIYNTNVNDDLTYIQHSRTLSCILRTFKVPKISTSESFEILGRTVEQVDC